MFPGHSVEGSGGLRFVKYLLLYGFCVAATACGAPAQAPALSWTDQAPGSGTPVAPGRLVEVRYVGKLSDGKVFDKSHAPGSSMPPFRFVWGVTRLLPGWDAAVAGMMPGGRRTVVIPPALAYGAGGLPGVVPPNATLVYEIEVLKVD